MSFNVDSNRFDNVHFILASPASAHLGYFKFIIKMRAGYDRPIDGVENFPARLYVYFHQFNEDKKLIFQTAKPTCYIFTSEILTIETYYTATDTYYIIIEFHLKRATANFTADLFSISRKFIGTKSKLASII